MLEWAYPSLNQKLWNLRSQNKKGSELLSCLHHMTFVHLSFQCNLNKYVKMEDTLVGKQKHKFVACVFFNLNLKTVGQKSPGGLWHRLYTQNQATDWLAAY